MLRPKVAGEKRIAIAKAKLAAFSLIGIVCGEGGLSLNLIDYFEDLLRLWWNR